MSRVSKLIKSARIKSGMTQAELAWEFRYTTSQFISNWERNISRPPLDTYQKLCSILNISPNEMLDAYMSDYEKYLKNGFKQGA